MSRDILKLIASETFGESYMAHKIELDLEANASSRIDEREPLLVNPKCGETIHYTSYRPLEGKVRGIANSGMQILTYFLDGSRHVYKIDDIAYRHGNSRKMVYPVVAGQVVVVAEIERCLQSNSIVKWCFLCLLSPMPIGIVKDSGHLWFER